MIKNNLREALILAGGKGTRLSRILKGKPKPLVEIGKTPLLKHQINLLIRYGIKRINLLVNYKSEQIKSFLEKEFFNIDFKLYEDGKIPLGSGGSILKHLKNFDKSFIVLYGDTFLEVDFDKFYHFHAINKSSLTVFAHPNNHPYDSDILICNSKNQVIDISGYPHSKSFYSANLVNAALYIVEKDALLNIAKPNKKLIDFAKDLIPLYIKRENIYAYKSREYIKDCGTEDRLKKVELDYKNKKHEAISTKNEIKSIFLDRDGTIIKNISHLNSKDQIEFINKSARAIKNFNDNNFLVSVVTNQPVVARGEITLENLKDIHNYIEWEIAKEGAFFDEISFCPHYPESGFKGEVKALKIKCQCRKPETGMLDEVNKKYQIDKKKSWIIGDSTADIKCGNNFNIKTILVETGFAGRDQKYICEPDFVFKDLFAASNFIINEYPRLYDLVRSINFDTNNKNIFISGLSNSGKSTFSSVIKDFIEENHDINCHIIRLDNYLLEINERDSFPNIFSKKIVTLIKSRFKKQNIDLKPQKYDKFHRCILPLDDIINIDKNDWVIFEGLITFDLTKKYFKTNQFFIECSETKIKNRFVADYKLRGLNKSEIEDLYIKRSIERSQIKMQKRNTNIIKL